MRWGLVAAAAVLAGLLVAPAAAGAAVDPCSGWSARTIASGLGSLENIEFDGQGGLILSASDENAVERLGRDGSIKKLIENVASPGGLRVRSGVLYFNTGDAIANGVLDKRDSTLETLDLKTGRHAVYAGGLPMANGLVFLPNGDVLISRDFGGAPAITVIPKGDRAHARGWAQTDDSNGMAVDPTGKFVYVNQTFKHDSPVLRIPIADPSRIDVIARVGEAKGLDDMTIDRAGVLYLAANGTGEVLRLDPRSGASCTIAGGFRNTSAVKFGCGPGWPSSHLFVVGFDGVVRELTPPSGTAAAHGDCSGRLPPAPAAKKKKRRCSKPKHHKAGTKHYLRRCTKRHKHHRHG
ncbi:MAG: hypothetical protein QOD53_1666 [Thermoleophilaceae bacterium]|nr:hypothetical protein [Thermoleophilaceae bacterium]